MKRRILHIAEIGIRVKDRPKMVAFYQDELGFELHKTEPNVTFLKIGDLDSDLGRVDHPQLFALFESDAQLDPRVSIFDHIAFEIPHEFYDEEYARFNDKGMVVRERSWPDSLLWRGRSFFFHDPEGNVVELIAAAPS